MALRAHPISSKFKFGPNHNSIDGRGRQCLLARNPALRVPSQGGQNA
jgi:hypothetical protein